MSDEQFLTRWSRRKQEAKAGRAEPAAEDAAAARVPAPSDRPAVELVPPVANLSNLPPIESIDAATDITAFLRKGIPQELSRAALRRAWETDPAIRDFIGLAENAWDFNDPNAMSGFGPLDYTEEQLAALVDRVVGGVRAAAEQLATTMPEKIQDAELAVSDERPEPIAAPQPAQAVSTEQSLVSVAAAQPQGPDEATDDAPAARPRTHGSALPR